MADNVDNTDSDGVPRRVIRVARLDSPLHQIALDASFSPEAQERLQEALRPSFEIVLGPLREKLANFVNPYASAVDQALQPLRDSQWKRGQIVCMLVERTGWIIPTESADEFADLSDIEVDTKSLEDALTSSFSQSGHGFASTWRLAKEADWLDHRQVVLDEARRCIESEFYSAAVTLLVQSSEGILIDWLFEVLSSDEKIMRGNAKPQQQAPDPIRDRMSAEWLEPVADAAISLLDQGSPEFDAARVFGRFKFGDLLDVRTAETINRHAIAHGAACGYGTPACAARAVALLGFVIEFVGMTRLLEPRGDQ